MRSSWMPVWIIDTEYTGKTSCKWRKMAVKLTPQEYHNITERYVRLLTFLNQNRLSWCAAGTHAHTPAAAGDGAHAPPGQAGKAKPDSGATTSPTPRPTAKAAVLQVPEDGRPERHDSAGRIPTGHAADGNATSKPPTPSAPTSATERPTNAPRPEPHAPEETASTLADGHKPRITSSTPRATDDDRRRRRHKERRQRRHARRARRGHAAGAGETDRDHDKTTGTDTE